MCAQINLGGSVGVPGSVAVLGNYNVVFAADATHTMSSTEYSNYFLDVTSSVSLTATRNLIAPLTQGQAFVVQNNTTGGQSITIIGSSGSGVTIADGYTVAVICDGNNYIQVGGTSVVSGSFTAGGDLSGSNTHQTVIGLQGNPVSSGTLGLSNEYEYLQWDGYAWQAQIPVEGEIIGQNSTLTPFSSCIDDAPIIQAWITQHSYEGSAAGTLKLVDPVLKTPLNLQPFANTRSEIIIYGTCRYAMNIAEFNLPSTLTISGGSSGGGTFSIGGPQADMQAWNSVGGRSQEPNNSTTDGYVGSAYEYMWIATGISTLPFSAVGQTLTVSAVGSGSTAFIGTYTIAAIGLFNRTRLVWNGASPPTASDTASNCTWSVPGGFSGNGLDFGSFGQPIPVLPVYNCKNLTYESYYHWLGLSNVNNTILGTKVHRIMGIASSTTAYIIGYNLQANYSLTLPDYGAGGTSISPTMQIYEGTPVFRMTNYNVVRNLNTSDNPNPFCVMDGTDAVCIWCTVENCSIGNDNVWALPTFVPVINDGCFWFLIRKCYFGSYTNVNEPASVYLTGTNGANGQYCGIGRIEDCEFSWYGIVSRQESGFYGVESLQVTNMIVDPILNYPGETWGATMVFDGGAAYLEFINCAPADGLAYVCETLVPNLGLYGRIFISTVSNIIIDNATTGVTSYYLFGPNLISTGVDLLSSGALFSNITEPPTSSLYALTQYSNTFRGYVDNAEIDRNADFSPVITLPYQLELHPILTVSDWNNLTISGSITASSVGADGYALWGPDLSTGKVIRLSASIDGSYFVAGNWTIAEPQVGDVVLTFIRIRTVDPSQPITDVAGYTSLYYPGEQASFNYHSEVTSILSPVIYDQYGGMWQNVIGWNTVTSVSASNLGLQLTIGTLPGNDIVVDPESVAVCYIPVSQVDTETIPINELVRLYRKMGAQITGATPGDVAIPTRAGFSFGSLGARISSDMVDGYLQLQSGSTGAITFDGAIQGSQLGSGFPVSYGIANINMSSDANLTLSANQFTQPILRITSTPSLTTTREIILPLQTGAKYDVYNHTTGSQSLTFIGISGTGVTVPNGIKAGIYCDGANYVPSGIIIGGDLSAINDISQTVIALQGNPILAQSITGTDDGYVLTWSGSQWSAQPAPVSFTAGGDLSGTNTSQKVVGWDSYALASSFTAPVNLAFPIFDSAVPGWEAATLTGDGYIRTITVNGSIADGYLQVTGLQDNPVASGILGATQDGYVLTWSGTQWSAQPSAISFTAGGDLSGSNTSQTVLSARGGDIIFNTNSIEFASGDSNPSIFQANDTTNSGIANNLTIQAQNETGTSSTGGSLYLTSGTGTSVDGYVYIQQGSSTAITVKPTGVVQINDLGTGVVHSDSTGDLTSSLIVNADIAASGTANIAVNKLAAGTSAQVLLNNSTPSPTWTTLSQDAIVSNAGLITVQGIQTIPFTSSSPTNNQVPYYNSSANQIQWVASGSGSGGGTVTTSFLQPAVGSNVNVFVNSTVGYSNNAILYLQDPDGNGGYYNVYTIPSSTEFTLTNIGGFGASQAGAGIAAGAVFSLSGKDVNALNLDAFGDGYDGAFVAASSGTFTATRDMFWTTGSWASGHTQTINMTGFVANFSQRLNLQNAPTNAIYWNGVAGGNGGATGTAGTAGATSSAGTLGIGNSGGAGGTGTSTNGGNGIVGALATFSNGGVAGEGGTGGTGTGGNDGYSVSAPSTRSQILFHRLPDILMAGGVLINGGGGGSGGGAAAGNSSNAGGGGGGGGSGGCVGRLNVNEIYVDNTTSSGAISVIGGNGGNGGTATSVGAGGGAGGGGGGGGYLYLNMAVLSGSGSGSTDVVLASGGNGGSGGNGDSTGSGGGYGGWGGNGGLIEIASGGMQLVTDYWGAAGVDGYAPSGTTGGSGGSGGFCGTPLQPPNPQITGVYPNFGSAAGGWTIYIAGANLSTVSTVKINGLNCTSVTYHSTGTYAGLISCVTPQYLSGGSGYTNGSSTGLTVQVTLTDGAVATSATSQQNYFYLPSNNTILDAHQVCSPFITTGTGISALASILPSGGKTWSQSTGADQPSLQSSFNSTGLNGLSFNGSSDYLAINSYSASTSTFYVVGQVVSMPYPEGMWSLGNAGVWSDGSSYRLYIDGSIGVGTIDTNAHVMWFELTGGANTTFNQNSTNLATFTYTGTIGSLSASYLGAFGPEGVPSSCGEVNYAADVVYSGNNSSADNTTVVSILNSIYNAV